MTNMFPVKFVIFLFGCFHCAHVISAWSLKKPSRDDVIFDELLNGTIPRQPIYMDEEIAPPITIAMIEDYSGPDEPFIEFLSGKNSTLELTAQLDGSEWSLVVTKQQDYEQISMRAYRIQITIGDQTVWILLNINNIFDNAPVITSNSIPCIAEELRENFATNCSFNVYDADGFTGNQITFIIEDKFNESRLFAFEKGTEIDSYNWEYTLYVREKLNYDQRNLYNFNTKVFDIADNEGSIRVILNVEDVPNKDPIWTKPFATERFPEKTNQTFQVSAIDGDTGINKPICFKLDFELNQNYSDILNIETDSGTIFVNPINRDERKQEFYPFHILAYKCDNQSWFITGQATLIVDDINDNSPEITLPTTSIKINEQQFRNNIFNSTLVIEDIDLGIHAQYNVYLSQKTQIPHSEAFLIVPNNGYQKQSFDINVIDTTLIDYENLDWQTFNIDIVAVEQEEESHQNTISFSVELINWNDELPIFGLNEYHFYVNETVPSNTSIGFVIATDRDIDDRVEYSLVGGINDVISKRINNALECELFTSVENAFDYERQREVNFQMKAQDTLQTMDEPLHEVFTQIRIIVMDVNDETPELIMPREILSIKENVREGIITDKITAIDPDTTANLTLQIDWKNSYATKPGFEVDKEFYEGCFIIEQQDESVNRAIGILRVNSSFHYNIDYEKFEIVYLSVIVTDLNQEINSNQSTAILTVRIEDENDNPPEFVGDTLTVNRNVVEEAIGGTLIGTINARDIDGPGNNIIQYSMKPINGTPDNLIEINQYSGVITVKAHRQIDCDDPPRFSLQYLITLYDGANETEGEVQIDIIDINNKYPIIHEFDMSLELYENATTGDVITQIPASDLDRDAPHNTIQYSINYMEHPTLQKYFAINELSGWLEIKLQGDNVLDRDHGEDKYSIYINLEDNYLGNGGRNKNQTRLEIILLDVNDNAPQMPSNATEFVVSESVSEDYIIEPKFHAHDIDDPTTPNAKVSYRILSIEPDDINDPPSEYENLFKIESYDGLYGKITTAKPLRGYHGKWRVTIQAYDHGDEWTSQISLDSNATYTINVLPYNFHRPEIIFPKSNANIRLDFNNYEIGKTLQTVTNEPLQAFEAKDEDGGIFGDITFSIASTSSDNDNQPFEFYKLNAKQSELRLKRQVEEKTYYVSVQATDGGSAFNVINNVKISFVNSSGEPYFSTNAWSIDFTENEEGLDEVRTIPEATDPKNSAVTNEEDKFKIYYHINKLYNPQEAELFKLNKETRQLTLTRQLDRESKDHHEIQVIATNSENYPDRMPSGNSLLLINVTVNDVNDNPPKFASNFYGVGISSSDFMDKILIRMHADDPDLDDVIIYRIFGDVKATGENILDIKEKAFKINEQSGELMLNFIPQDNMKGQFEFEVEARDLVNHTDYAKVKVFIVAESDRIKFVFLNSANDIIKNIEISNIVAVLSRLYGYDCNVDDILTAEVNGVAQETLTDMRVHFLKDNEVVPASNIQAKSSDPVFIANLKTALMEISLNLFDVPVAIKNDSVIDPTETLALVLMVVSVVLGILCILITMAFFFRTKGLKRQIKALSETTIKFNSPELQKKKNLPNSNVFATEKSNPILNNTRTKKVIEEDNKSISSNDSDDLADVRNNPIFKKRNENSEKNQNGTSQA